MRYSYPVPSKKVIEIVKDSPSHQGQYKGSIDFAVALGTPVLASADGVVSRVKDDSNKHGNDPKYGQLVNYITISHQDNELSEYLHLAKDSVLIKIGDKVKCGQQIATTGLSGWMTAPHLHFMVYKKITDPKDFHCLEIALEV